MTIHVGSISFTVRGPPVSTNQGYRLALIKRRPVLIKSDAARYYQTAVTAEATIALSTGLAGKWSREWPVVVELDLYFPDARGDVDGPIKFVLDALQGQPISDKRKGKGSRARLGGIIANDRQVLDLRVRRLIDRDNPRTVVRVRQCPAEAA